MLSISSINIIIPNKFGFYPFNYSKNKEIFYLYSQFITKNLKYFPPKLLLIFSQTEISKISLKFTRSLNDFELISQIGGGSFGSVFLVCESNSNNYFALKVIDKVLISQKGLIKYVFAERDIQIILNHPFLVKFFYAFQTKNKLFLVQEYCENGNLSFYLKKQGRLSERQALICIAEIILAIEYLHSKNIVYRDLKPENIVIDEKGHLKLTDFGLAKELVEEKTFSFCGTYGYLAPEMVKKEGHGFALDWFSIGLILFEMLTGVELNKNKEKINGLNKNAKILIRDVKIKKK